MYRTADGPLGRVVVRVHLDALRSGTGTETMRRNQYMLTATYFF